MKAFIADIGGTNARFAEITPEGFSPSIVLQVKDFPDFTAAASTFMQGRKFDRAAIALAGPVSGDIIALTNHPWRFSLNEVTLALNLTQLKAFNDFEALALGLPYLEKLQILQIGNPSLAVKGVVGPGTGLGMAGLVKTSSGWQALPGEGGHASIAARNIREWAVIEKVRQKFGHVSAERLISGPGLLNIHHALNEISANFACQPATPAQIQPGSACPHCQETLQLFLSFLGNVAGNLALTIGAKGGIYLGGGILTKLKINLDPLLWAFLDKGRFRSYLTEVPLYLIGDEYPAFLGLKAAIKD